MLHVKLTWHKQVLPRMKSDDIHSLFIQECAVIPHLNFSALRWVLAGVVQTGHWAHLHIVGIQFGNLVYFFTCHRFQPLPTLPPGPKEIENPYISCCECVYSRPCLSYMLRTRNSASFWYEDPHCLAGLVFLVCSEPETQRPFDKNILTHSSDKGWEAITSSLTLLVRR